MSEEEKGFTVRDRRFKAHEEDQQKKNETVQQNQRYQPPPIKDSFELKKPVEINFSTFIFSLASSAFIALGEEVSPITGQKSVNLPQAQETIDLLTLLQDKTRGNLTQEEESLLTNLLFSVRMRYVELARKPDLPKG